MKHVLAWLCLALTLTVQTGAAQDLADNIDYPVERELTAEVSADGIDEIVLDGHDGKTTIEVGSSDRIELRVTIEAKRKGLISRSRQGRAYVEEERFSEAGIELLYQKFEEHGIEQAYPTRKLVFDDDTNED